MSKETPNSSTSINFPPINNTNNPHTTKPQSEGHAHHDSQLSQVSHSAHTSYEPETGELFVQLAKQQKESFSLFANELAQHLDTFVDRLITTKISTEAPSSLPSSNTDNQMQKQLPDSRALATKVSQKGKRKGHLTMHSSKKKKLSHSSESESEADHEFDENDKISLPDQDLINELCASDSEQEEGTNDAEDNENALQDIAAEYTKVAATGKPLVSNLAKIVTDIWHTPINKEKITKKFELFPCPENCLALQLKKCNSEIWSQLQANTRQADLKSQQNQSCIVKSATAITSVVDQLINLKSTKDLTVQQVKMSVSQLIPSCIDAVALLSCANAKIEQIRRNSISATLDKTYQNLAKNVPDESEQLFGDDLTKRITNLKTKHQILTKNTYQHRSYPKNEKRFPQNPGSRYNKGYKNNSKRQQQNNQYQHQKNQYQNNRR